VLIHVVSYQFVARFIESWFDVKVEGALDAGLNLGRATIETLANDLTNKARTAGTELADIPERPPHPAAGAGRRRTRRRRPAAPWSATGQLIAATGRCRTSSDPRQAQRTTIQAGQGSERATHLDRGPRRRHAGRPGQGPAQGAGAGRQPQPGLAGRAALPAGHRAAAAVDTWWPMRWRRSTARPTGEHQERALAREGSSARTSAP